MTIRDVETWDEAQDVGFVGSAQEPSYDDSVSGVTGAPAAPSGASVAAAIEAAVADLVASAPGALDTLNELAAALGDDANYAATLTAALAGKEAAGTTATHAAAADPHPGYLTPAEGNTAYDAAGAASSAVSTHAGAADPHAGYLLETDALLVVANRQAASYTLVIGDAGKVVEMNNASANNLTVPPNSSVAFPVGTVLEVMQYGAGQTTLVPGGGVTIRSPGGKLKIAAQYGAASLRKIATDEWAAEGNVTTT